MTCHYGGRGSEGSKLHPCTRLVAPLSLGSESSIIAPRALCTLFAQFSFLVALPNQPTNRRWVIFWTLILVWWWVGLVLSKLGHPTVMQVMFAVVVLKLALRRRGHFVETPRDGSSFIDYCRSTFCQSFTLPCCSSISLLPFVRVTLSIVCCICCSCLFIFIVIFGCLTQMSSHFIFSLLLTNVYWMNDKTA